MADENCKYYKPNNNSKDKFCTASSRISGRAPGDYGELGYFFQCTCNNHKECDYFLEDNKLEKLINK